MNFSISTTVSVDCCHLDNKTPGLLVLVYVRRDSPRLQATEHWTVVVDVGDRNPHRDLGLEGLKTWTTEQHDLGRLQGLYHGERS